MIEINLLPVEEEALPRTAPKGLGFRLPKAISKGFGGVVALLLAIYVMAHIRASSLKESLETSKQTLRDLENLSLQAKATQQRLPTVRERASVFQTHLENRKVWSKLFQEIVRCCPEEIQLTDIRLGAARTGTSGTQRPKELVIKGFYLTATNPEDSEMKFSTRLHRNETMAAHYQRFVPMTELKAGRTDFTIRCTGQ